MKARDENIHEKNNLKNEIDQLKKEYGANYTI